MNLVLFTHPEFAGFRSIERFTDSLARAYAARGHRVEVRAPRARLRRRSSPSPGAKWAGYVDQYMLFPREIEARLRDDPDDTLYVFCDQALGPWVPHVAHRPHVVHCHDLLALRSALGHFPQNATGASGRLYQRYIRWGFRQARHFISVSDQTRRDLHEHGGVRPVTSEVVYNGMNFPFAQLPAGQALQVLRHAGLPATGVGMLLHVSGNHWYKNVPGVVRLYAEYARRVPVPLPLWLVGCTQDDPLRSALAEVPGHGRVVRLGFLEAPLLNAAYGLARAFLFPSLAEGFGWPIVEAQACGCPVVTTDASPMNEVGGPHARYLPLLQASDDAQAWARNGADVLAQLLALPDAERRELAAECVAWSRRFEAETAIASYLRIYQQVMDWERAHGLVAAASMG
jgi:glycosyltransferase involved in cell wall biosynthesis